MTVLVHWGGNLSQNWTIIFIFLLDKNIFGILEMTSNPRNTALFTEHDV